MMRRLALLYVAMFMGDHSWFQMIIFPSLSMAQMIYYGDARPMKTRLSNNMNLFNEGSTLTISYFVLIINGMTTRADMFAIVGEDAAPVPNHFVL